MSERRWPRTRASEGTRLVLLTLLGLTVIVLAFHARLHGEIARVRSRAVTVEAGVEADRSRPSGRATGARAPVGVAESWAVPAPPAPEIPARWVASSRPDRASPAGEDAAFPPVGLRGEADERGVNLRWLPDPRNPAERVTYEVYRWREGEAVRSLGAELTSDSFRDADVCAPARYSYCVVTLVRSSIEAVEILRSRRSDPVDVEIPERYALELLGVDDGRARVRVSVPRTGRSFETFAGPGDTIGSASDEPTGFVLEGFESVARDEEAEVRFPVFRPDGSREVEDGRPVFRSRAVVRTVSYPAIRFRDACGAVRTAAASSPAPSR